MYLDYIKMCLRSKRGIEGLPLKYVVIILVAVIVIGIVMVMTDTLNLAITDSTTRVNESLVNQTYEALKGL